MGLIADIIQKVRPAERISDAPYDSAFGAKGMALAISRADADRWAGYGSSDIFGLGWTAWQDTEATLAAMADQSIRGQRLSSMAGILIAKHVMAYQSAPMRVYARGSDELIANDPLQKLLDNPNPWMSGARLAAIYHDYRARWGNAYIHIVRSKADNTPLELYPYHNGHMRPVPGETEWVKHFLFTDPNGKKTPIPTEDVIHLPWPVPNPDNPLEGQAPTLIVVRELGLDNEMTRLIMSVFKNDAMMRGFFVDTKGVLPSDQQRKLFQEMFRREHTGENRHKQQPVLNGGLDWRTVSLALDELVLTDNRRTLEDRAAAAWLVNSIYAGLTSGQQSTTYDNLHGSRQFFYEDTIDPMWQADADAFTRALLTPEERAKRYVWHSRKDVIALRKDKNAISARVNVEFVNGLITRNEARAALELDAAKVDGFYQDIVGGAATKPDVTDDEPEEPDEPLESGKDRKSTDDAEAKAVAYWKAYDDPAEAFTAKLYTAVAGAFEKLLPIVLANVPGKSLEQKDREDWQPFTDAEFAKLLDGATKTLVDAYIADVLEQAVTEVGADWGAIQSDFDEALARILKGSTDLIKETVPTVKTELQRLLADNFDRGADVLKGLIRGRFKDIYSESRAALIARTTATYSTGASQKEAWQELDVTYTWLTQRDKAVRGSHMAADGAKPDKDGMFTVGGVRGPHPGALGSAKESANCRCVLRARVND